MKPKLYIVARVPRCPTCGYPGRDRAPHDCGDGKWIPLSHRNYKAGDRRTIDNMERAASKALGTA